MRISKNPCYPGVMTCALLGLVISFAVCALPTILSNLSSYSVQVNSFSLASSPLIPPQQPRGPEDRERRADARRTEKKLRHFYGEMSQLRAAGDLETIGESGEKEFREGRVVARDGVVVGVHQNQADSLRVASDVGVVQNQAGGWQKVCTPSEVEANAASFFKAGGFKATRCPSSKLLEAYRQQMPGELDSFNVLVVGCNSGSDGIAMARLFSQNPAFNYSSFSRYTKFPCGKLCNQCGHEAPIFPTETVSKMSRVTTHCFEALPINFRTLKKGAVHFSYENMDFHVVGAAVTDHNGPSKVPFPRDGKVGKESIGIGNKVTGVAKVMTLVPTQTVDKYVQLKELKKVDILLIDTEGHDAKVLKGAISTLESGSVRYVEFEYHGIGLWKTLQLKETIDYLDNLNYQCFWIGETQVWPITKCWSPQFEGHSWSNVGCYHQTYTSLSEIFASFVDS